MSYTCSSNEIEWQSTLMSTPSTNVLMPSRDNEARSSFLSWRGRSQETDKSSSQTNDVRKSFASLGSEVKSGTPPIKRPQPRARAPVFPPTHPRIKSSDAFPNREQIEVTTVAQGSLAWISHEQGASASEVSNKTISIHSTSMHDNAEGEENMDVSPMSVLPTNFVSDSPVSSQSLQPMGDISIMGIEYSEAASEALAQPQQQYSTETTQFPVLPIPRHRHSRIMSRAKPHESHNSAKNKKRNFNPAPTKVNVMTKTTPKASLRFKFQEYNSIITTQYEKTEDAMKTYLENRQGWIMFVGETKFRQTIAAAKIIQHMRARPDEKYLLINTPQTTNNPVKWSIVIAGLQDAREQPVFYFTKGTKLDGMHIDAFDSRLGLLDCEQAALRYCKHSTESQDCVLFYDIHGERWLGKYDLSSFSLTPQEANELDHEFCILSIEAKYVGKAMAKEHIKSIRLPTLSKRLVGDTVWMVSRGPITQWTTERVTSGTSGQLYSSPKPLGSEEQDISGEEEELLAETTETEMRM